MNIPFLNTFRSEWLKKKGTAAAWLVVIGGFFIPFIILIGRVYYFDSLAARHTDPNAWVAVFTTCWKQMAVLLLPFGVILATSLITQLEFRNNTWKQTHTAPQRLTHLFFAKLLVILIMLLQFFALFNLGVYLVVALPSLAFPSIPYPDAPFPFAMVMKWNATLFLASLPIVALQYLISLQVRNFLVPLGVGIGLFIASLVGMSWQYSYAIPYIYCSGRFLLAEKLAGTVDLNLWAAGYFVLFTVAGYVLYIAKKEKG